MFGERVASAKACLFNDVRNESRNDQSGYRKNNPARRRGSATPGTGLQQQGNRRKSSYQSAHSKQHLRTLFLRAGITEGRKRVKLATAVFEKEQIESCSHVIS